MAVFMSVQFCKGIESLGSKGGLEDIQKWLVSMQHGNVYECTIL